MARKPRIEFEGAFYHVIVRGNQKQIIFKDNDDYLKYLELLAKYKLKYKFLLSSYVLMKNHVHLLIETRQIPLSKICQGINQSYTMYFNKKYKTVGHLFQGRYKAILCDRDDYLLTLVKYIHLNPFRAGIVKNLKSYEWSSHHEYAKKTDDKGIIDTDQVLRLFSENKSKARRFYKLFIGDEISVKKDDVYSSIDHRVVGNEEFIDRVMNKSVIGRKREIKKGKYKLSDIGRAIETIYSLSGKQIRGTSKERHILKGRKLVSLVAKSNGHTGREIAEYIQKDPAIVTRYLREEKNLQKDIGRVLRAMRDSNS